MALFCKFLLFPVLFCLYHLVGAAVHERVGLPHDWREADEQVSAETVISLQVELQYRNIHKLDTILQSVSDVDSVDYGKYMTKADLQALFYPTDEDLANVVRWLTIGGASGIRTLDDIAVDFQIDIGSANKLLNADLKLYTDGTHTILRTLSYSIPDDLIDIVDLLSPTTYFGTPTSAVRQASKATSIADFEKYPTPACEDNVTVTGYGGHVKNESGFGRTCFRKMYDLGDYQADSASGSTIGFANFDKQYANESDLAIFESIYHLAPQNFTKIELNNASRPTLDTEGNLDGQVIASVADSVPITSLYTGGLAPFIPDALTPALLPDNLPEPYLAYFRRLLTLDDTSLPFALTHSYGQNEQTYPERYARRVCTMIGLLGLRGRTVVFSSGDDGPGNACRSNVNNKPAFNPTFPATCPYVTSVGGTNVTYVGDTAGLVYRYADYQSGGGFSNYFGRAWYQQSAVEHYINHALDSEVKDYYRSYVNFSGRGFPDIAAFCGEPGFLTIIDGEANRATGTSVAAPLVAAIISLLNDARFRAGMPAMGFINPWLYRFVYQTSKDVVLGGSTGCDGNKVDNGNASVKIPYASWNATPGWDPVTGLGVPNFEAMLAVALKTA